MKAKEPEHPDSDSGQCDDERQFLVEWRIDIVAGSFREAAEKALRIQQKPDSIANVFDVTCAKTGIVRAIDLLEDASEPQALRCSVCGNRVGVTRLRSHLCHHNPNADSMDSEDVRDMFVLDDPGDTPVGDLPA